MLIKYLHYYPGLFHFRLTCGLGKFYKEGQSHISLFRQKLTLYSFPFHGRLC